VERQHVEQRPEAVAPGALAGGGEQLERIRRDREPLEEEVLHLE
jgi:hypothetical protein